MLGPPASGQAASGQAASGQGTFVLQATGVDSSWTWPASVASPEAALDAMHRGGFFGARVDSARADTLFASPGNQAVIANLTIEGVSVLSNRALTEGWTSRPDSAYDADRLDADLAAAAQRYAALGYVDAVLTADLDIEAGAVDVTVRVAEGRQAILEGVEVVGARRASRAFTSRVAGVEPGLPVEAVDVEGVRSALDATGLYAEVGEPILARSASGGLVLQVPVREAAPGTFDVVLGYLPPTAGRGGSVVGNGRVSLRNLFGGGRTADAEIVRNPGLTSAVDLSVRDPFAFGTAFGLAGRFAGEARDSTFSRQRYEVGVSYPVARGLSLVASLSREAVRPGVFGADSVGGRPRIRRTDATYLGVGVRFQRLDAPRSPRRGATLDLTVEQGRRGGEVAAALGDGVASSLRRLALAARGFVPTLPRQVAVVGVDAALVQAVAATEVYDEADLFRLGGAQSLRGYDEEAFVGRVVGRALAEYRVLLDAESFAFAFVDLGLAERPTLPGSEAETQWLPGYGAGLRVRTGVGLASVSYALNPDLALGRGKVHLGVALGL
ncbi:MAG: POTRA domain-containing protein [Bacteroidota bacterium]